MPRQRVASKASQLLSIQDARVFSHLPIEKKIEFIKTLSDSEAIQLKYFWEAWARDNQLPPEGIWTTWVNLGGRGAGKTRAGAEWIRKKKDTTPYLHLIGRTAADVRDVMVDGEAGILAISPPWDRPDYQRSKRRVVWDNGAQAITFSADEPESMRGPQCLVGDTPILMGDGSQKPLEYVQIGDLVKTRKGPRRVIDHVLTKKQASVYWLISHKGYILIGTPKHPIWVEGRGFVPLSGLREGMQLALADGSDRVANVTLLPETYDVYDITVEDAHEFFADNILVHNCGGMWCDEIGSWKYSSAYDMALFGLRLGKNPQSVCTTTPRATPLVKRLLNSPLVKVSRSTTYDNRANLAEAFFKEIITRFEKTRLGQQELLGLLIEDSDEALWNREKMIEAYRVLKYPQLKRIAVAIDPAVTSGEESNETGIIVGGVGIDGHAYILDDASMRASPHAWASQAIAMYYKYKCDRMIAEGNQGGELIENTIRTIDRTISFKRVHARHGKYIRAEPVAALYEKGMVHHVGTFPYLEDEQCQWVQGEESPNHLDALVWLVTELMLHSGVYASTVMDELAQRRVAREKFNKERAEQYW